MRPRVAVFDFTTCEGCELTILNCEAEFPDLASNLEFVNFREAMTERSDSYDIAFIDGACTRDSEVKRLREIRRRARYVVPLGTCACYGGVAALKNAYSEEDLLTSVYGLVSLYGEAVNFYDTIPARPISAVVQVDFTIPGCPIVKEEFVRVTQEFLAGRIPYNPPDPVCAECKVAGNVCVFDKGKTCLGPVTRGGCKATCVTGGAICWGCRGLIDQPNINAEKDILKKAGLSSEDVIKKFNLFNSYQEIA